MFTSVAEPELVELQVVAVAVAEIFGPAPIMQIPMKSLLNPIHF
jgi:hypothetical protein